MERSNPGIRPLEWLPVLLVGVPVAVALGASSLAASLVALGIVVGVTTYDTF